VLLVDLLHQLAPLKEQMRELQVLRELPLQQLEPQHQPLEQLQLDRPLQVKDQHQVHLAHLNHLDHLDQLARLAHLDHQGQPNLLDQGLLAQLDQQELDLPSLPRLLGQQEHLDLPQQEDQPILELLRELLQGLTLAQLRAHLAQLLELPLDLVLLPVLPQDPLRALALALLLVRDLLGFQLRALRTLYGTTFL
jgi:hypothetical protein